MDTGDIFACRATRCNWHRDRDHFDGVPVQIPLARTTWRISSPRPPTERTNAAWPRANRRGGTSQYTGTSWNVPPAPSVCVSTRTWSRPPAMWNAASDSAWHPQPRTGFSLYVPRSYKDPQHEIRAQHELLLRHCRQTNREKSSRAHRTRFRSHVCSSIDKRPRVKPSCSKIPSQRTQQGHGTTRSALLHNRRKNAVPTMRRLRKAHRQLLPWHRTLRSMLCRQQNPSRYSRMGTGPVNPPLFKMLGEACSMPFLQTNSQRHATGLGARTPRSINMCRQKTPVRSGAGKTTGKHSAGCTHRATRQQQDLRRGAAHIRQTTPGRRVARNGTQGLTQFQKGRCWLSGHGGTTCPPCWASLPFQRSYRRNGSHGPKPRRLHRKVSHGNDTPCPFGTSIDKRPTVACGTRWLKRGPPLHSWRGLSKKQQVASCPGRQLSLISKGSEKLCPTSTRQTRSCGLCKNRAGKTPWQCGISRCITSIS